MAALYLLLGVAAAVLTSRRGERKLSATDLALCLIAWPLYVPLLLGPDAHDRRRPTEAPGKDYGLLLDAIGAIDDPTLASLLPSPAQLSPLGRQLELLAARVCELDDVLSRDELDPARLESAATSAQDARVLRSSIDRLRELRTKASAEREELLSLCRRLRVQITVLRFSGQTPEDVSGLVAQLLGRVEGLGAALSPDCDAPASDSSPGGAPPGDSTRNSEGSAG
jgi:hypothetical protein